MISGNTSYKGYILNKWLGLNYQIENLVEHIKFRNWKYGNSSLDDEKKLKNQIDKLINRTIQYFDVKLAKEH